MFKLPFYSVIAMIITGPLIEEIVFRLSFKENIKNKYLYYFLTVSIFAGIHVLNGISSPLDLLYIFPYGSMAISLSYILDKTDNIFASSVVHACHNALSIILVGISAFLGV